MKLPFKAAIIASGFTMIALTGCSKFIQSNSQKSARLNDAGVRVPGSWKAASTGRNARISTAWLKEFNSPTMTRLVLEAVNRNPNLNATATRLRATKQGTIGSRAALLPRVNASTSASRSRNGRGAALRDYNSSFGLSLNASWEADIWGRLRDLRSADITNYQGSIQDYRAARLSLAANTARAYCNLVTSEQLLTLAHETLASFKKNKNIVERNYKAGVPGTRAIAVQLSRTNVASAQRSIESRKDNRDRAARALEALLGRYPAAEIKARHSLPNLKSRIPSSLPAKLLVRRPDVVAAQLDVFRSAKVADAARKNLLPSLSLSTSQSTGGGTPINLINPQRLASSIAASLSQAVYRGGAQKATAKQTLLQNKAAIFDYANTAIRAFREVENALATDASLIEQEKFLIIENKQATFAERSAELDYSEGIENSGILEILESQRRANNARAALINLKNRRLQNRIDLYLALGGDFYTVE